MRRRDTNPDPGAGVVCVLCDAKVPPEMTVRYLPFKSSLVWWKSKHTIEFISKARAKDRESPYMDLCETCFGKVIHRMRILKYFKQVIRDDKGLESFVSRKKRLVVRDRGTLQWRHA